MSRQTLRSILAFLFIFAAFALAGSTSAQTLPSKTLPDAPPAKQLAWNASSAQPMTEIGAQASAAGSSSPAPDPNQPRLTRSDAEKMALHNNPKVSASHLVALAQHQVVRETRSAYLPTAAANLTAMDAATGSRISAGSLTSSRLFEHAGAGANLNQLITDFGRTTNLIAFSKLQEKAQNATALATEEDIVVACDQAFYNALQAQALLKVAQQNVDTRQTTDMQVREMTKNKLKSILDLSFADVNLSQAKLLLLDAQNNADSSMAALDAVLGLDHQVIYALVDDRDSLQPPPDDAASLIALGLQQRPDLQALNFNQQAEVKFSHAQRDQLFPTISAAGTVGTVPVRPDQYYTSNWWGGVGVNMSIPIFNGFLYSAQAKEANLRAQASAEQSRQLRDVIVRDIRTSWLAANTAYQRVTVSQQLLDEANLALKLAQTRYQMGLSSIVELSQAQYQQTDAAIGNTNAQYQYRLALATLNFEVGATP
jgi:outer membrane protein